MDNEVADALTLATLRLTALTGEPTEVAGQVYLADQTTWDPAGMGAIGPYYVLCTAAGDPGTYKALFDITGVWYVSSIATPTLDTDELAAADSTPQAVAAVELKNTKLSSASSGEDWVYTMPEHLAANDDWSFIVIVEAAFQVTLNVHGNDNYYVNGSQCGAGVDVQNAADTVGESMYCYSTEAGVYCESKYATWVCTP